MACCGRRPVRHHSISAPVGAGIKTKLKFMEAGRRLTTWPHDVDYSTGPSKPVVPKFGPEVPVPFKSHNRLLAGQSVPGMVIFQVVKEDHSFKAKWSGRALRTHHTDESDLLRQDLRQGEESAEQHERERDGDDGDGEARENELIGYRNIPTTPFHVDRRARDRGHRGLE